MRIFTAAIATLPKNCKVLPEVFTGHSIAKKKLFFIAKEMTFIDIANVCVKDCSTGVLLNLFGYFVQLVSVRGMCIAFNFLFSLIILNICSYHMFGISF